MARRFNGTSDVLKFNPGGLLGGGLTAAALFSRTDQANGHWMAIVSMLQGTLDTSPDWVTWEITAQDFDPGNNANGNASIEIVTNFAKSTNAATKLVSASDFYVIAITKQTGSHIPRVHFKDFTAGSAWVHSDMETTAYPDAGTTLAGFELRLGQFQAGDHYQGDMVVAAVWNTHLSDLQIEAALTGSYTDWLNGTGGAGPPASVWPIGDQARLGAAGAAIPDDTGAATWKSTAGTTFVADPAGWSWSGAAAAAVLPPQHLAFGTGLSGVSG